MGKTLTNKKTEFDFTRDMSWSQLSCFDNPDYPEYSDPNRWYERYVLKIKEKPSQELIFGSMIDKKIQDDRKFLPKLERFPNMQFAMNPTYKGIKLVGYADGWDHKKKRGKDDKTGVKPWTQERADRTGQLTMYTFMIYLEHGIKPEDIQWQIDWMQTCKDKNGIISLVEPCVIRTFYTKRNMQDILKFAKYIERTVSAMKQYVIDKNK